MIDDQLVEFTTRHQVYLERLKAGEIKATDILFVNLAAELARLLVTVRVSSLSELTDLAGIKLVLDIEQIHTAQYQAQLVTFTRLLHDLAHAERDFELESLDEATIETVTPDDGDAKEQLWAAVTDRPMSATGKLLAAYLGAWMAIEVSRAGDMTRKAISEGWAPGNLLLAFRGTAKGGLQDGLLASARRNTATTIRTAIQHVSSAARAATMAATVFRPSGSPRERRPSGGAAANAEDAVNIDPAGVVTRIPRAARAAADRAGIKVGDNVGLLGYRWSSILDDKTSQVCRSLDGQVFKFGRGPLPPAHPNCRSNIVAEMLGRWRRRGPDGRFKKDDRVRPTAAGNVPARTTYYDWLKGQPADFQDDALGVTRAELFRKGGLSAEAFSRLNLGKNFEPLTLEEMRQLAPRVFRRAGI